MKIKSLRITGLAFLFLMAIGSLPVHADIPNKINYQGYLTDSGGTPINGAVSMTLSIYDAASGGTPLWSSDPMSVTVNNGIFNVNFGDAELDSLTFDKEYYLGVRLGEDPEMTPRKPLTSVGYAFRARRAEFDQDTLAGLSCSGGQAPKWDGSAWVCGDAGTPYTAGAGLVLTGAQFSVDQGVIQARVSQPCNKGYAVQGINADGTVSCVATSGVAAPPSSTVALIDGIPSAGISIEYARGDHQHAISPGTITGVHILDGTITNTDISPSAAIADTKLATLSTVGKVADSALSTNVVLSNSSQTLTGLKTFNPSGGVVPFSVDGTKAGLVANLNSDMLDGQHALNFAPTSHTHEGTYVKVTGDSMTGKLNLPADGLAAGTNQLVLSSGRVGIGTATPGQKLTITGTGAVFGVDNAAEFQGKNSSGTYESYLWPRGLDDVTYFNYGARGLNIRNNASQSRVFIQDGGNVGIGTTNPTQKLEVLGNVKISGTGNGLTFPDGTTQTTAPVGGGVSPGLMILGETPTPPPGYTYPGRIIDASAWSTKAGMPTGRQSLAAATVNNRVYAIGGWPGMAANEEYDPATNTWTVKANMLTGRLYFAAVAVNNKIYAIGGCDSNGSSLGTNEEYDPVTNTWTAKANMPTARVGLAGAAVNNRIYAIGGDDLGTNEEYDPAANTWTLKAPMSTARGFLAAAVVHNKIYAIGGMDNHGYYSGTNEEYDPVTNTWTARRDMPAARSVLAAAAVNSRIYAIGGIYGDQGLRTTEEYDPSTDTWTPRSALPTARDYLAAAAANNRIYAVGGHNGSLGYYTRTNEEFDPGLLYVHKKD